MSRTQPHNPWPDNNGYKLPPDEREAISRHLGLIDKVNEALTEIEADIAGQAMAEPEIQRSCRFGGPYLGCRS